MKLGNSSPSSESRRLAAQFSPVEAKNANGHIISTSGTAHQALPLHKNRSNSAAVDNVTRDVLHDYVCDKFIPAASRMVIVEEYCLLRRDGG